MPYSCLPPSMWLLDTQHYQVLRQNIDTKTTPTTQNKNEQMKKRRKRRKQNVLNSLRKHWRSLNFALALLAQQFSADSIKYEIFFRCYFCRLMRNTTKHTKYHDEMSEKIFGGVKSEKVERLVLLFSYSFCVIDRPIDRQTGQRWSVLKRELEKAPRERALVDTKVIGIPPNLQLFIFCFI